MTAQRFSDRSVVVTGAASGIGAAMVQQFVAEGARVLAADINPPAASTGAVSVQVDVSEAESVRGMVEVALETFGTVDVLCNNAGIGSTTNVIDCTVEEWDRVFAVNARGVFLGTKLVLPTMLAQGRGVIVNTASVAGMVGFSDRAAYCASKGAVIALTKQVAVQYASAGIRCSCICPGTVDSPWVGRLLDAADDPTAARASLVARQPMGRLGTGEEVAAAALYLASDEAAFCTGTALVIDGGITSG